MFDSRSLTDRWRGQQHNGWAAIRPYEANQLAQVCSILFHRYVLEAPVKEDQCVKRTKRKQVRDSQADTVLNL